MVGPPSSRAAYLSQPGQSSESLAFVVNTYRDKFRLDGRVLCAEDGSVFAGAVFSYLFTVSYRLLRSSFNEAAAEEHADAIACVVSSRALSKKHFRRWVLTDFRAKASTYLHRCAQFAVMDVYRRTKAERRIVHVSLDNSAGVRRESEDGEEGQQLDPADNSTLSADKAFAFSTEISDRELYLAGASLREVAVAEGVSIPVACRRRQGCRSRLVKVLLDR